MKKLVIISLILLFVPIFPDAPAPVDPEERDVHFFLHRCGDDTKKLQQLLDNFLQWKEPRVQKKRNLLPFLVGGGVLFLGLSVGNYCNMSDVNLAEWTRLQNKKLMIVSALVGMSTLAIAYHGARNLDAHESALRSKYDRHELIIKKRLQEAKEKALFFVSI